MQKRLVHICPHNHRRAVVVLPHHFCGHLHSVLSEGLRHRDVIYNRDFYGSYYPFPVTEFRDKRILRIVRYTQEIATHIFQQTQVTHMHFISQSITLHIIVLMAVCAHQLHMTPVKEETLIRVETEISESECI